MNVGGDDDDNCTYREQRRVIIEGLVCSRSGCTKVNKEDESRTRRTAYSPVANDCGCN